MQLVEERQQEWHRDEKGEHVGNGLAHLNARQAQQVGQGEDERDETDTLPAAGQERGPAGLADALEHHVGHHDDGL